MTTSQGARAFPRHLAAAGIVVQVLKALLALVPSVGVLAIFVFVVKAMLEGDRRERAAQAKWEREHPSDDDADRSR